MRRPCILIFDSLRRCGVINHTEIIAMLREYLTFEFRAKVNDPTDYTFNEDNIGTCIVKVPQQLNFTDSGLYLLQYAEQFFVV